jgi:hypothetical protein
VVGHVQNASEASPWRELLQPHSKTGSWAQAGSLGSLPIENRFILRSLSRAAVPHYSRHDATLPPLKIGRASIQSSVRPSRPSRFISTIASPVHRPLLKPLQEHFCRSTQFFLIDIMWKPDAALVALPFQKRKVRRNRC